MKRVLLTFVLAAILECVVGFGFWKIIESLYAFIQNDTPRNNDSFGTGLCILLVAPKIAWMILTNKDSEDKA